MSSTQPEKRQRISQACDECKKRKKQCDGRMPCDGCTSRSEFCRYSQRKAGRRRSKHGEVRSQNPTVTKTQNAPVVFTTSQHPPEQPTQSQNRNADDSNMDISSRWLYDLNGTLVYIGDSASLSYLQTIRRLVEECIGPSPFTKDDTRYMMLEPPATPPTFQHTYILPDREAALFMIESFFSATSGLISIFDRLEFQKKAIESYDVPLQAEPIFLCHFNLVCAIGLQLRKDITSLSSQECDVLGRLDSTHGSRSHTFYLNAKHISDALYEFEDGGLGSVQTLILKTVYLLTICNRHSAWIYLGMAVRLAYALGIHREETLSSLSSEVKELRKNIWRTLYILDSFISSSSGRPSAVPCIELNYGNTTSMMNTETTDEQVEPTALKASVNASALILDILSRVYQKRKISRTLARSISTQFYQWNKELPSKLHWQQISMLGQDPKTLLAQLHVNLVYFHGIILLTRPFFMSQLTVLLKAGRRTRDQRLDGRRTESSHQNRPVNVDVKDFSSACVRSATQTIYIVQSTFLRGALPRKDPFVIYWLFTAALIVFSNNLCPTAIRSESDSPIKIVLNLLRFMGEIDKQAQRYSKILETFNDTFACNEISSHTNVVPETGSLNIIQALFNDTEGRSSVDDCSSLPNFKANAAADPMLLPTPNELVQRNIHLPASGNREATIDKMAATAEIDAVIPDMSEPESFNNDVLDFDTFWHIDPPERHLQPETWLPLYPSMDLS